MDSLIYVLEHDPEAGIRNSRIADTSFVRKGRIPPDFDLRLPFPGAPDLAVEVVLPDETAKEILAKVRDYLRFGSEQVWVLYPEQKELHQYVSGSDSVRVYQGDDRIECAALFPDLEVTAAEFFALPELE